MPERPRILYITYTVPWNPRYGGAMRCYGIIEGLAARSELHVVFAGDSPSDIHSFLHDDIDLEVERHVLEPGRGWDHIDDEHASKSIRSALGRGKYHHALRQLIREIAPDGVWYFEAESVNRTYPVRDIPTILDHCDVRWRKKLRLARLENGHQARGVGKALFLRLDDIRLSLLMGHSLIASADEVGLLWPVKRVIVLPNGYDFSRVPFMPRESHRLLFYGSLFYQPNADGVRWMCREVWHLIKARNPEAQLDIVGLGHEALADLGDVPGVTFYGFVDDLDAMMRQSAALVVPLRVGGTRIKILEAWAKGLPVISTSVGAEGLSIEDGKTALLGDTAEDFASACIFLLENPSLGLKIADMGYLNGKEHFHWAVVHNQLYEILQLEGATL